MAKNLLAISNHPDSTWLQIVNDALQPLGALQVVSEQEAPLEIETQDYDLMIIDATAIDGDVSTLVVQLHGQRPTVPIVVATTSPTWQRARQIFLAGASDYIRRSLDKEKILENCRDILKRSHSL